MIPALLTAGLLVLAIPSAAPVPSPQGSTVRGPVSFFDGDVTIPANETRRGDVTVYGGSVNVQGTVTHDLRVFGGDVEVDGQVGHDLVMFGGSVHLGPNALIGHDVAVIGGDLNREPGARVGHEVVQGDFATGLASGALPPLPQLANPSEPVRLALSAGLVLLALLLQLLFPRQVARTRDALDERPFASLGLGCLTVVAGVLLAALLAVTVVLVLASAALVLAMVAGSLLGLAGVTVLIGQRLLDPLHAHVHTIPTLLIGGVLVAVLINVPFVGPVFGLLVGSMALGAVVLTRFGTRPHPPLPPLPAAPPEAPR